MKTILLRLLTFVLCAMVLGFVAQAGFNVEPGKVFVVGRCQVCFEGMTPEFVGNESFSSSVSENVVGIAQVELASNDGFKPVFRVERIFSVRTDENGYFMLKNLSSDYTYVLLGIQHQKNIPVPVHFLSLANAREKQGKMVNLGFHKISFSNDSTKQRHAARATIDTNVSNQDFISYFINKSPMRKFISKIKSNSEFWGKTNAITVVDSGKISFANLETAPWQSCETN